jgi:sortase B
MNRNNADRSKQKKKRTAKDIVLDILLVVFLLIAVGSGAYLGRYYYIAKNDFEELFKVKGRSYRL